MSFPTYTHRTHRVRDPFAGSVFDRFFTTSPYVTNGGKESSLFNPRVDVLESSKDYKLVVDLPGFEKKDITIEVADGVLSISANSSAASTETKASSEAEEVSTDDDYKLLRSERRTGAFKRSFTVDETVDTEKVVANLTAGVLEVVLPKVEPQGAVSRTVTVN